MTVYKNRKELTINAMYIIFMRYVKTTDFKVKHWMMRQKFAVRNGSSLGKNKETKPSVLLGGLTN